MPTVMNPTTVDASTGATGTPRLEILVQDLGASPRLESEKSMRLAVYRPEFRQDRTEVRTTMSMIVPAPGMPNSSITATYGLLATLAEFHGRRVTTMAMEPM